MPFAAGQSAHPVSAHATGEVIGQVAERVGLHPDLAVLLVSPGHAGALEDSGAAVRRLLEPTVLLGAATAGVLATGLPSGREPSMVLWAAVMGPVAPLRLAPGGSQPTVARWSLGAAQAVIVLTDRLALAEAPLWARLLGERHPGIALAGGATGGPGRTRLLLDGTVSSGGAVGVLVGPGPVVTVRCVQGHQGVGPYYRVTRAEGSLLRELDGAPAMQRLIEVARDHVPVADLGRMGECLHLGWNDRTSGTSDVRPRVSPVVGMDQASGALALGQPVDEGATARFRLPDPGTADAALAGAIGARRGDAALVFVPGGWPGDTVGVAEDNLGAAAGISGGEAIAGDVPAGASLVVALFGDPSQPEPEPGA